MSKLKGLLLSASVIFTFVTVPLPVRPYERQSDTCRFCGIWKWNSAVSKEGQPGCHCAYLKITKVGTGKLKLSTGFDYPEGKINWTDDSLAINNADSIYLRPISGKLVGKFVSANFEATHGADFTYKITCELKSANELVFTVWSSIRGGETEKGIYNKISN